MYNEFELVFRVTYQGHILTHQFSFVIFHGIVPCSFVVIVQSAQIDLEVVHFYVYYDEDVLYQFFLLQKKFLWSQNKLMLQLIKSIHKITTMIEEVNILYFFAISRYYPFPNVSAGISGKLNVFHLKWSGLYND